MKAILQSFAFLTSRHASAAIAVHAHDAVRVVHCSVECDNGVTARSRANDRGETWIWESQAAPRW